VRVSTDDDAELGRHWIEIQLRNIVEDIDQARTRLVNLEATLPSGFSLHQ